MRSHRCQRDTKLIPHPQLLGFIPILFRLFDSKEAQLLLPEEEENEDEAIKDHAGVPMTGWNVCWLWIPALCDLTATTVRLSAQSKTLTPN